jgi:hypothetical protein
MHEFDRLFLNSLYYLRVAVTNITHRYTGYHIHVFFTVWSIEINSLGSLHLYGERIQSSLSDMREKELSKIHLFNF